MEDSAIHFLLPLTIKVIYIFTILFFIPLEDYFTKIALFRAIVSPTFSWWSTSLASPHVKRRRSGGVDAEDEPPAGVPLPPPLAPSVERWDPPSDQTGDRSQIDFSCLWFLMLTESSARYISVVLFSELPLLYPVLLRDVKRLHRETSSSPAVSSDLPALVWFN